MSEKPKTNKPKRKGKWIGLGALMIAPVVVGVMVFNFGAGDPAEFQPEQGDQDAPMKENHMTIEEAEEVPEESPVDVPGGDDLAEGQEIAQDFINAFHPFDVKDPTGYLAASEPFMTERLKRQYENIPRRGSGGVIRETVLEMEVLPSHLEGDNQVWRIGTTGEAESEEGKEYTFTEYTVLVTRELGEWKVDGVKANGQ